MEKPKSKCCNATLYGQQVEHTCGTVLIIWCDECNGLIDYNGDLTGVLASDINKDGMLDKYRKINNDRADRIQSRDMRYICDWRNNKSSYNQDPYCTYEYNGVQLLGIFEPSKYTPIQKNEDIIGCIDYAMPIDLLNTWSYIKK